MTDSAALDEVSPEDHADRNDQVFKTAEEKYRAVINDIRECTDRGQPVLDDEDKTSSGGVRFRNDAMHGTPVRIAFAYVQLERSDGSTPQLALVQVAETLEKRA